MTANFRALRDDPACSGSLDGLVDLTRADLVLDSAELRIAASEVAALRSKAKFGALALVAPGDAMFGMMRVFEVVATQHFRAIRVFRGMAEAEAWLLAQQSASHPPE